MTALAALAALAAIWIDPPSGDMLALIAATTVWARQDLMHRINAATDRGDTAAFGRLHGASVVLQLAQLAVAAVAVVRLATFL